MVKIAFFDTHSYDKASFTRANETHHYEISWLETRLNSRTAELANGHEAVCVFVEDHINAETISTLKRLGVKYILLRCAGFNNVDLKAAKQAEIEVARVPEYSPHAIAEHAVGLLLSLNRKIHRAYLRVRELNFSIEGLTGFDLHGKTVGVIGTGRIGNAFAKIMLGFGCKVLAFDIQEDQKLKEVGVEYTNLSSLFSLSDIISLHVPLNPKTLHIINQAAIEKMKKGVVLINSSRGALIETQALINGLKSRKIAGAALDVYEEEEGVFFS